MKKLTNKTKTVLFAGLVTTLLLPFIMSDHAQAEEADAEKIEKWATEANKITEKLETVEDEDQREELKKRLGILTSKLNAVGLYTDEQFEQIKEDISNERPTAEQQAETPLKCACHPELWIITGFDYTKWGWHGSTEGNWLALTLSNPSGISEASTASWGADFMHVWNQAFLRDASTSRSHVGTMIQSSSSGLVKQYGTTYETITQPDKWYFSPQHTNVNGGDQAVIAVTLRSIS